MKEGCKQVSFFNKFDCWRRPPRQSLKLISLSQCVVTFQSDNVNVSNTAPFCTNKHNIHCLYAILHRLNSLSTNALTAIDTSTYSNRVLTWPLRSCTALCYVVSSLWGRWLPHSWHPWKAALPLGTGHIEWFSGRLVWHVPQDTLKKLEKSHRIPQQQNHTCIRSSTRTCNYQIASRQHFLKSRL